MIVYLDTSALVPLMIEEPTSSACGELWDAANKIVCARLAYIESSAAVAMAERMGRITTRQARAGRAILDELWPGIHIVELDLELMSNAAQMSVRHGLRAYDATHCAAALETSDTDLVAASGDKHLIAAWRAEGIAVRDMTRL